MEDYQFREDETESFRFHILNTLVLVIFAFAWLYIVPGRIDPASSGTDKFEFYGSVLARYVIAILAASGLAFIIYKICRASAFAANMGFGIVFLGLMSYASYTLQVFEKPAVTSSEVSIEPKTAAVGVAKPNEPVETATGAKADEREQIITKVRKLTADGNFASLEAMAETMRSKKERTVDGWLKLTSFYDGTNEALLAIEELYGSENAAKQLQEWKDAYPESVTPLAAQVNFLIKQAWAARTGNVSVQVRPEQWSVFQQKLKEAVDTLNQMGKMKQFDPDGHSHWFTVGAAVGLPRDRMEEVMLDGIKHYHTAEELYRGMAFYLLPQWQGEPGDVETYAEGVRRKFKSPQNDIIYARIVGFMFNYHGADLFKKTRFKYDDVRTALKTLIQEYPQGLVAKKLLCCLAAAAHDRETAQALFKEIPEWTDKEIPDYWHNREKLKQYKAWAENTADHPLEISPIEKAIASGNIEDVKAALEAGEDVNRYLSDGNTPLMLAIMKKHPDIVTYLLQKKADVKGKSRSGYSVAAQAVTSNDLEVLTVLMQNGIGINDEVSEGAYTMLHIAALKNCGVAMEWLLKKPGVNVNAVSQFGETPLYSAAEVNNSHGAQMLIDHSANMNLGNRDNITPLHVAAYTGAAEVIEVLLKAGADPKITSRAGTTALQTAERRHKQKAIELLQNAAP